MKQTTRNNSRTQIHTRRSGRRIEQQTLLNTHLYRTVKCQTFIRGIRTQHSKCMQRTIE